MFPAGTKSSQRFWKGGCFRSVRTSRSTEEASLTASAQVNKDTFLCPSVQDLYEPKKARTPTMLPAGAKPSQRFLGGGCFRSVRTSRSTEEASLTASMQANNVFEMAHKSEERLLKRLSPGADTSGSGQTGRRERATKHALHSCACVCMHTSVAPSVFVTDIDTAKDSSCW